MVAAGQVVGLVEEALLLQVGWRVVAWVCSGGVGCHIKCVSCPNSGDILLGSSVMEVEDEEDEMECLLPHLHGTLPLVPPSMQRPFSPSQVGVLSRGQALTVWARGGAAVRFRVLNTQPSALVRLGPGCELHIAPKPRALMPFGGVGQAQDAGRRGQQQQHPGGNWSLEQQHQQQNGTAVPLFGGPGQRGPWQQQQQQQAVVNGGVANGRPEQGQGQGQGVAGGAAGFAVGGLQPRPAWAAALPRPALGPWGRYDSSGRAPYDSGACGGRGGADGVEGASGGGGGRCALAPAVTAGAVAGSTTEAGRGDGISVAGSGGMLDGQQRAMLAGQVNGSASEHGYGSGNGNGSGDGLGSGQRRDGGTAGPTPGTPGELRTAGAVAAREVPGATPVQGQQGEQQQLQLAVPIAQVLRLRVLDPPASKYLVPLPTAHAAPQEVAPGSGPDAVGGPGEGINGAVPAAPAVHTWLTVTAAVAPSTAAALLGLPYEHAVRGSTRAGMDESGLDNSSNGCNGCMDGARVLVRLHGRSAVRDLLAVLIPEPCCPPGHVMLAPPLQHVLGVLPHMAVTVAPAVGLGAAAATAAAAAAEAAPLPSLALHPLPVPAIVGRTPQGVRQVQTEAGVATGSSSSGSCGSSGSSGRSMMQSLPAGMAEAAATAAAAGLESARTALPYQAVLSAVLTEGNGSTAGGAAAPKHGAAAAAAAGQQQQQQQQVAEVHRALSDAVLAWLAAQLAGVRALIAAVRHADSGAGTRTGASFTCAGPRGCSHTEELLHEHVDGGKGAMGVGAGVGLLLPVASGTVIHFRTALPDGGDMAASIGDGRGNGAPGGGGGAASDFCLLVHAVSSRRHNHNHNHHAEGQTQQQQQQQAGGRHHSPALHVVSETRLAALLAAAAGAGGDSVSTGASAPVAAGAHHHGHSTDSKQQLHQQNSSTSTILSVRVGGPVTLPDASYAGASHTAAIAARPLPPCPSPTTLHPQQPTSNLRQHHVPHSLVSPFQDLDLALDLERDLGVDLAHVSWLGEQLRGSCRRLLPLLDPRVGGAVAAVGLPRPGGVLLTGPPGEGRRQACDRGGPRIPSCVVRQWARSTGVCCILGLKEPCTSYVTVCHTSVPVPECWRGAWDRECNGAPASAVTHSAQRRQRPLAAAGGAWRHCGAPPAPPRTRDHRAVQPAGRWGCCEAPGGFPGRAIGCVQQGSSVEGTVCCGTLQHTGVRGLSVVV